MLIGFTSRHLTGKNSRRNTVNADLSLGKSRSQHASQMYKSGLGGSVGELAVTASLHDTGDTGDVHDARRDARSGFTGLGEQRQETGGYKVLSSDVGLEGVGPGFWIGFPHVVGDRLGRLEIWLAIGVLSVIITRNTGVVHEQMNTLGLLLLDFANDALDVIFGGDISW